MNQRQTESVTRILLPEDHESILAFSRGRLNSAAETESKPETEHESEVAGVGEAAFMLEWTAPWRMEALNFYLPLGWSFGCFENEMVRGYLLAQPLLFFGHLTQSLWVEHLEFDHSSVAVGLVDTVVRWAKDKHLQRVLLCDQPELDFLRTQDHSRLIDNRWIEVKTTRWQT